MKRGKRAQFYIIAAVILVIIILGLAGVKNVVITKEEPVSFFDLGTNLGLEGPVVIDHGVYNEKDISKLIENFTNQYANYIIQTEQVFDLVIVHGDKDTARITNYTTGVQSGEVTFLGTSLVTTTTTTSSSSTTPGAGGNVEACVKENCYTFTLGENENFFLVFSTAAGAEQFTFVNIPPPLPPPLVPILTAAFSNLDVTQARSDPGCFAGESWFYYDMEITETTGSGDVTLGSRQRYLDSDEPKLTIDILKTSMPSSFGGNVVSAGGSIGGERWFCVVNGFRYNVTENFYSDSSGNNLLINYTISVDVS